MRSFFLCLFLVFVSNIGLSQKKSKDILFRDFGIKIGYFGEFILHPGFTIGIDYSVIERQIFHLHWDSEAGAYFHKWNNNGYFFQSSLGSRFVNSFGGFIDLNLGIGYLATSPNGKIYKYNDAGEVTSQKRPTYSHFRPSISLLFGWDGSKKHKAPILINCGLEVYGQTHFNHSILPHFAGRVGVVLKLKNHE